jgi:hypothetical protein
MATPDRDDLRDVLKLTAVALKGAEVPFALGGGYAAWARGAPEPEHDADVVVAAADAGRAADAVTAAGLDVERPPEDWLFKVRTSAEATAFVDVLWRLCDSPVDAEVLARTDVLPVLSVHMPVMRATDVVAGKLAPLTDHYCDFASLLPVARALREQVDWADVRRRVADNDYAQAFLFLAERLGISSG